jgi:hypothetical protein
MDDPMASHMDILFADVWNDKARATPRARHQLPKGDCILICGDIAEVERMITEAAAKDENCAATCPGDGGAFPSPPRIASICWRLTGFLGLTGKF